MLIAHYIGNHSADGLAARAGWALTRYTQAGPFGQVTHCEAIHEEFSNGEVLIASASLRDGGVRAKRVRMNPAHWMIVNCPVWSVSASIDLFEKTKGNGYDLRGALATRLPGNHNSDRWFCNEWVGAPFLPAPQNFGPHQFAAVTLALSVGVNVTSTFFGDRA